MAGVNQPRRSARGALLVALAAALAAAAWVGRLTAFLGPSVQQAPLRAAVPRARQAGSALRGQIARAARGGAEEEEEEDDDDYEFNPAPEGMDDLKPGQEFSGVVVNTAAFGAFVDIGFEKQGLVPISKLSDDRVENVEDVVTQGQGVTVWVVEYKGDRLTLSMSKNKIFPAAQRADLSLFSGADSSEWLTGKVVNVRDFGAFVAVAPPGGGASTAQGLVHITQLKDGFVENVADEVKVGDEVQVRVLKVDLGANKLALTMKSEASGGGGGGGRGVADLSAFQDVPDTVWLSGVVKGLANFGAFVEVQPPEGGSAAQGLVHISQIKDGFIEDPGEELEMDQEVQVRVVSVDADAGKMALTMRQIA